MSLQPTALHLGKPQTIATELLARIVESNIMPGQTFATEAQLLEIFQVSRPTLRESIRILESQGVLGRRPGPGGGLVVHKPSLDMLASNLSVYMRFNGVPFAAVLSAREVIEPALAAKAARHGRNGDFEDMHQSIERMIAGCIEQSDFFAENRFFHGIVARASGDAVLETFWGTISLIAHGEQHGLRYSSSNRQHVILAHRKILDACRRRDPIAAASAMAHHLNELEHLVNARRRSPEKPES